MLTTMVNRTTKEIFFSGGEVNSLSRLKIKLDLDAHKKFIADQLNGQEVDYQVDFTLNPYEQRILGYYLPEKKYMRINIGTHPMSQEFAHQSFVRKIPFSTVSHNFYENVLTTLAHETQHLIAHHKYPVLMRIEKVIWEAVAAWISFCLYMLIVGAAIHYVIDPITQYFGIPSLLLFAGMAIAVAGGFLLSLGIGTRVAYLVCYDERKARAVSRQALKDPIWGTILHREFIPPRTP